MKQEIEAQRETGQLIKDAQSLLAGTTQAAEEKVVAARQRLTEALQNAKEACGTVQEQVVTGARATDRAIRMHPFPSLGVALGVGAVVGYLLARRSH
jgi:ElaB/YqjD/DUF883 family membrane-anchored ribosome-binding protein